MNFLGGHVGCRRLGQRSGIERLAVGQAGGAVAGQRRRAQCLEGRDLAVDRRIDFGLDDPRRPRRPVAGDALGLGAVGERGDEAVAGRGLVAQFGDLAERQVERPARGEIAARRLRPLVLGLIIEKPGEFRQARQIGLGVGGVLDRMGTVQEIGDTEIIAVLLGDVIGVLDTADPEFGISDQILLQPVNDDLAVERGGGRQAGRIDRRQRRQRRLVVGQALAPGLVIGLGVERRAQRRQRAGVNPKRGREAGRILHRLQEDLVEQAAQRGVARTGDHRRDRRRRGGRRDQRGHWLGRAGGQDRQQRRGAAGGKE